ncbi:MAG: aldehyde ferredoxin oxidoreductase, partial [Chloroflexi bacterium]|nr:aldehyde ferredoxin oxidoreductase [Chloroflexota bacterium]
HDTGLPNADDEGFILGRGLRSLGVLEPVPLEDLGPAKVKAFMLNQISSVVPNCLTICSFPGWSMDEQIALLRAATGWDDISVYEIMKVGERALNLARVFNMREGWTVDSDHLAERSYQPTRGGALAEGGIDREELREAVQLYYGMMGWDPESGRPSMGKLQELDIAWAAEYLPA